MATDDVIMKIAFEGSKGVLAGACGLIPVVGPLLGKGVGMLLDEMTKRPYEAWPAVRVQVEAMINRKVTDLYDTLAENFVKGAEDKVNRYARITREDPNNLTAIKEEMREALFAIQLAVPHLSNPKYAYAVLPRFVQLANLHILMLRDQIQHGRRLGFEASDIVRAQTELSSVTGQLGPGNPYMDYRIVARRAYEDGWLRGRLENWPLRHRLDYHREMYVRAIEFVDVLWPYLATLEKKTEIPLKEVEVFFGPRGLEETGFPEYPNAHQSYPQKVKRGRLSAAYFPREFNMVTCWYRKSPRRGPFFEAPQFRREDADFINAVEVVSVINGVRGMIFHVSPPIPEGEGDRGIVPGRWVGRPPAYGADIHEKFSIPGWEVGDVYATGSKSFRLSPADGKPVSNVTFSFRPAVGTVKALNVKQKEAKFYHLVCADTGEFLDLASYSLTRNVGVTTREASGQLSQEWEVRQPEEGRCELVNRYSGAPLSIDGEHVHQHAETVGPEANAGTQRPSPQEDAAGAWALQNNDDGTRTFAWTPHDSDGSDRLLLHGDGQAARSLGANGDAARWVLLPVIEPLTDGESFGPTLERHLSGPYADSSSTSYALSLPEDAAPLEEWRLTFLAPVESRGKVKVLSDDVRLVSCEDTDQGALVTLAPSGNHPLAPGTPRTFDLSLDTADSNGQQTTASPLAEARLNGRAVLIK